MLSIEGRMMARRERRVLRVDVTVVVRVAGSYGPYQLYRPSLSQEKVERTLDTTNATTATPFNTRMDAEVPIKVCRPRRSKWLGQIGRSQGFVRCWVVKRWRVRAAQARIARLRRREREARERVGRRRRRWVDMLASEYSISGVEHER